jgi:hypothetical protein
VVANKFWNCIVLNRAVLKIDRTESRKIIKVCINIAIVNTGWIRGEKKNIQPTLGDSPERMRWRTKQNLTTLLP